MNVSEVSANHFLPTPLYYTPLPPFNYCEYVMMKITTINNALTFYIFFPTKEKFMPCCRENRVAAGAVSQKTGRKQFVLFFGMSWEGLWIVAILVFCNHTLTPVFNMDNLLSEHVKSWE